MRTIRDTKGNVTAYGFICGYVETIGDPKGWSVRLDMINSDPAVYRVSSWTQHGHIVKTYQTLREARRAFRKTAKAFGLKNA